MALPHLLAQDGSYLVFRKLEQDVPRFHRYLEEQAESFARILPAGRRLASARKNSWLPR